MLADFGYGVLLVTFAVSIYAVVSSVLGQVLKSQKWVESSRLAMLLTFPLTTLAALSLIYLLVNNDFNVGYVYEVTSLSMPTYLKVTALWGGQAGSLLFWTWLLSLFTTAVTLRKWDRDREFLPWVVLVSSITLTFFLMLNVFFENPFARLWETFSGVDAHTFRPLNAQPFTPADGQGLNPLLRHPGMIIHPPMLYLGFVSFVIPFAFGIAALATGRTDDRWIRITRRWTLVAWLFLSLGLILGGRWAYDVLGWGGYWAWDPVEIAAFLPWLSGTAFLHSVMIQEKRGMFKEWNMILVIITYVLVILGTFLTRSGVLSSVHAFAKSAIGPSFFIFIGLTMLLSTFLLIWRWDTLKGEAKMHSLLSREALFLLNNLLFMGILVVCLWGMLFPILVEWVNNEKITMAAPFYERATGPLFAAIVLLMGVAPLSAWGHSTIKTLGRAIWKPLLVGVAATLAVLFYHLANPALINDYFPYALVAFFAVFTSAFITLYEFGRAALARGRAQNENFLLALWRLAGRNRRRYGGYTIHLGVVVMTVGIIGLEMFQTETQKSLAVGESIQLAGYTVQYDSLAQFQHTDGRWVTRAVMSVFRDGQFIGQLTPRYDLYPSGEPMTIPGVRSTIEDDLYVILVNWEGVTAQVAPFKVYHNPLVNWLWYGVVLFMVGTLVASWPDKDPEVVPVRQRREQQIFQPGD